MAQVTFIWPVVFLWGKRLLNHTIIHHVVYKYDMILTVAFQHYFARLCNNRSDQRNSPMDDQVPPWRSGSQRKRTIAMVRLKMLFGLKIYLDIQKK